MFASCFTRNQAADTTRNSNTLTAVRTALQSSFCHVPLEQSALAFLPGARTRLELRETVAVLLGMAGLIG